MEDKNRETPKVVFEGHQQKAFDGALDLTKLLISLSTGTLALTAVFIKDILKVGECMPIPNLWLLYVTWGLMLLSIFFGLLNYGAITGILDGADIALKNDPEKRLSPYSNLAIVQNITFYLGILALIVYVAMSLK